MTPDSIRRIQEGKVFDYTEPPPKPVVDPITAILEEQHQEDVAVAAKTKKVKAGRTVIEVPTEARTAPETNLTLLQDRPAVDYDELVQWLIAHPGATHAEIGMAYGRAAGWFSTVLVTEEFQSSLEPFKSSINNPAVTLSIEDRMRALVIRSVDVLQTKLSVAAPGDALVLEAAKLGVRALGLGNRGPDGPQAAAPHSLESLADRLSSLVTSRQKGSSIGAVPQATEFVQDVTPKGE